MKRFLALLFLCGCASTPEIPETPPIPQVVQVVPVKEQTCGFVRKGLHCCFLPDPPMIYVKCVQMTEDRPPKPLDLNPKPKDL
jgi:hypothetical protein